MERSRARSLIELLAERHIDFFSEASAEQLEQQRQLDQQRAQAYTDLAVLAVTDVEEIEKLHAKLHALERQQQELTAKMRTASPRYAALQYPQPLDAKAAQEALDAGTLLLSFLVGGETIYLFAISKQEIISYELPVEQKVLEEQVQAFREALDVYSLENTLNEAIEQSRRLYEQLISPAQAAIDTARRLLICPDGPLHLLPFGALVVKAGRKPVYLGQYKPLHTTFSMTIYAQSRQAALSKFGQPGKVTLGARKRKSQALECQTPHKTEPVYAVKN